MRLTPFELEVIQPLWSMGRASIREILEKLPSERQPEYSTVQTIVYRLEKKGAVKRVRKIGNAHIFEPLISKKSAVGILMDDLIDRIGGSAHPLMAHLIETKKLNLEEIKQIESIIKKIKKRRK